MSSPTPLRFVTTLLGSGEAAAEAVRATLRQDEIDWRRVIWLASSHLILPSFTATLHRQGAFGLVPNEIGAPLDAARSLNTERNRILRLSLKELTAQLNRIGLKPLLLKGANALLPDAYPGAGDRMLGDLDLWLPEAAHPAATAALLELGYRVAEESWQFMLLRDRHGHHHGTPLHHETQPVRVELHRRLVKNCADDERLATHLTTRQVELAPGVTVHVPDIATRMRHNFLHAQINDRQARQRCLNLRQLLEFARLAEMLDPGEAGKLLDGLQPGHHRRFLEYWAMAEHWLGLPYPESLPRSPHQQRELSLTERVAESRAWSRGFRLYDDALRLPRRLLGLGVRLVQAPGYFPARARAVWEGLATANSGRWR